MSKIKDFILTVLEEYQSGLTVETIANFHGISQQQVYEILEQHGHLVFD